MSGSEPGTQNDPYAELQERLGYRFKDRALLERALTHPSYSQQAGPGVKHNQRLEFLGDAVLGLILAEQLYASLPSEREGVLTQNRSALANGTQLSRMARERGVPPHLRLSEAEERNRGRDRDSILEDALEAIIGAIYLDSDLPTAKHVVLSWYGDLDEQLEATLDRHNPKGRLQEIVQPRLGNDAIIYDLVDETGPAHLKTFFVEVRVNGQLAGSGEGSSKKEAEEHAALVALRKVHAILDS